MLTSLPISNVDFKKLFISIISINNNILIDMNYA